jgi:hypothetical protein
MKINQPETSNYSQIALFEQILSKNLPMIGNGEMTRGA